MFKEVGYLKSEKLTLHFQYTSVFQKYGRSFNLKSKLGKCKHTCYVSTIRNCNVARFCTLLTIAIVRGCANV